MSEVKIKTKKKNKTAIQIGRNVASLQGFIISIKKERKSENGEIVIIAAVIYV